MPSPPSAGNPVNVGPFKRIVGINWPTSSAGGVTRYMTTHAIVISGVRAGATPEEQIWSDPILPWDGIAPDLPLGFQNISIKERAWDQWSGTSYFDRARVYDASGVLLADDTVSALGISKSAPVMPQTYSFAQWQYASVGGYYWPAQTGSVSNPMGLTFYSNSGVVYQMAMLFLSDPPVQNYRGGFYASMDEMQTAMKADTSPISTYVAPLDMRSVTMFYNGQTYAAIGWRLSTDGASTQPRIDVLLKTVGTTP